MTLFSTWTLSLGDRCVHVGRYTVSDMEQAHTNELKQYPNHITQFAMVLSSLVATTDTSRDGILRGGHCHLGLKHLLNNGSLHVTGSKESFSTVCMKHFVHSKPQWYGY